jgi:hypothetical protein
MIELVRTNDVVLLSALEALLASAGVETFVLDRHASALDGSIGAVPRRLMVRPEDGARARRLLEEAGYGAELRPGA